MGRNVVTPRMGAILALLAIGVSAPGQAITTELPGSSANGLFVTVDPFSRNDICNLAEITGVSGTQTVPVWPTNLDGVTFLIQWSDLETVTAAGAAFTEAGGQTFTCPNGDVRAANLAEALALIPPGVHLGLAVRAGIYTPAGLMAQPGMPVSQAGLYASVHSMYFSEPPLCTQAPVFWEAAFVQSYLGLMTELSSYLTQQGRIGDLKLVQLSGMDDQSAETFVPTASARQEISRSLCDGKHPVTALDGTQVKPGYTSDNQLWLNEGYVSPKAQGTFQSIAASLTQIFTAPDLLFSVAIINFHGMPVDNVSVGDSPLMSPPDFTRTLIGGLVGAQGAPAPVIPAANLAVSWQGLNVCEPRPVPGSAAASRCKSVHGSYATQIVCESADGIAVPAGSANIYNQTLIAWQTNTNASGAAACGKPGANVSCSGDNYVGLVENGIDNGARFIEIWPDDVVKFNGDIGGKDKTDYIAKIHNYWLAKAQPAGCYYIDGSGS